MEKDNDIVIGGIYRHYKGNLYRVLALATHSETLEKLIVYIALYGNGQIWARPLSIWNDVIEKDGKFVTRFTKIEE